MKRLIIGLLCVAMVFAMCACGDDKGKQDNTMRNTVKVTIEYGYNYKGATKRVVEIDSYSPLQEALNVLGPDFELMNRGYIFDGWYIGDTEVSNFMEVRVPITVTAHWKSVTPLAP